ncbi:MAG: FAD-binding oxidoreductase [Acidobacteriota bacterium]
MRVKELPRDDDDCGWIHTAAMGNDRPIRRLSSDLQVDAAIVGAGFTGLAIARRLARRQPDWRIAVLDAQRAGFGASGRCSGFVVDQASFVAAMPAESANRFIALSRQGIRSLRDQVLHGRIDCDWDETGWLHGSATDAGRASLEALERWLDARGEPYEHLDAAALARLTGSSYYREAIRMPGTVLIQPAALMHGLVKGLPESVRLFEQTPVYRLRRDSSQGHGAWTLRARGGSISAERVFVAVNGLLPQFGLHRQRLFPVWTFGSLTRPLSAEEEARLGSRRPWGLLAQDPLGSSVRRTADGRLLIRNSVRFSRSATSSAAWRATAVRAHRQALEDRFPTLREIAFEHTWGGLMGMSRNGRHVFGSPAPGLWAAGGYNAAGIALGTISGELLADAALGHESPALDAMRALPGPAWIPPEPFFGVGARWKIRQMETEAGSWI